MDHPHLNLTASRGEAPIHAPHSAQRRDFLLLTAQAMGAVGAGALLWPFCR